MPAGAIESGIVSFATRKAAVTFFASVAMSAETMSSAGSAYVLFGPSFPFGSVTRLQTGFGFGFGFGLCFVLAKADVPATTRASATVEATRARRRECGEIDMLGLLRAWAFLGSTDESPFALPPGSATEHEQGPCGSHGDPHDPRWATLGAGRHSA